jgi:hypothetical protein
MDHDRGVPLVQREPSAATQSEAVGHEKLQMPFRSDDSRQDAASALDHF